MVLKLFRICTTYIHTVICENQGREKNSWTLCRASVNSLTVASAMSSPPESLCSSQSAEDIAGEATTDKLNSGSEKPFCVKKEVSKSPTPEPKAKTAYGKKTASLAKAGAATCAAGEEGLETSGQQQSSSRKKRARATPSEEAETNGRKSATDSSGRESSLWAGGEGEGPVQGSLLEEVLAEKRMALMRSPQVMQFLQQRQMLIQAAQHSALLHHHHHPNSTTTATTTTTSTTSTTPHFCVGELEDDANS